MSTFGEIAGDTQISRPLSGLESELPASGMEPGDTFYATDTRQRYETRDGLLWMNVDDELRRMREQAELDRLVREHEALFWNELGGDRYGFEIR